VYPDTLNAPPPRIVDNLQVPLAPVKFALTAVDNVMLLIAPVKPVRFNIAHFSTVTFDFTAIFHISAVNVALSTTTLVYDAFHQSKLDTSVQLIHLAILPLLSLNSYTRAVSISYNQNQDVLS
jgi:hypothetical protein